MREDPARESQMHLNQSLCSPQSHLRNSRLFPSIGNLKKSLTLSHLPSLLTSTSLLSPVVKVIEDAAVVVVPVVPVDAFAVDVVEGSVGVVAPVVALVVAPVTFPNATISGLVAQSMAQSDVVCQSPIDAGPSLALHEHIFAGSNLQLATSNGICATSPSPPVSSKSITIVVGSSISVTYSGAIALAIRAQSSAITLVVDSSVSVAQSSAVALAICASKSVPWPYFSSLTQESWVRNRIRILGQDPHPPLQAFPPAQHQFHAETFLNPKVSVKEME